MVGKTCFMPFSDVAQKLNSTLMKCKVWKGKIKGGGSNETQADRTSVAYNNEDSERKVCILYVQHCYTKHNLKHLEFNCYYFSDLPPHKINLFFFCISFNFISLFSSSMHTRTVDEFCSRSAIKKNMLLGKLSSIQWVESIAIFIPGALLFRDIIKIEVTRINQCYFHYHF